MIELQKRYNLIERCLPVTVIDMLFDTDIQESNAWIINKLGNDTYLKLREECENKASYWVVFENHNPNNYHIYKTFNDIIKDYCNFSIFGKDDKSSFPYWFAHWCSFQLCALNLGIWKFKYLFHDLEKPWLKLFFSYKKVQKWHRKHSNHHLEYGLKYGFNKVDWHALMIDWECSHMSKKQAPLLARETMEYELAKEKWKPYEKEIRSYLEPILNIFFM